MTWRVNTSYMLLSSWFCSTAEDIFRYQSFTGLTLTYRPQSSYRSYYVLQVLVDRLTLTSKTRQKKKKKKEKEKKKNDPRTSTPLPSFPSLLIYRWKKGNKMTLIGRCSGVIRSGLFWSLVWPGLVWSGHFTDLVS